MWKKCNSTINSLSTRGNFYGCAQLWHELILGKGSVDPKDLSLSLSPSILHHSTLERHQLPQITRCDNNRSLSDWAAQVDDKGLAIRALDKDGCREITGFLLVCRRGNEREGVSEDIYDRSVVFCAAVSIALLFWLRRIDLHNAHFPQ